MDKKQTAGYVIPVKEPSPTDGFAFPRQALIELCMTKFCNLDDLQFGVSNPSSSAKGQVGASLLQCGEPILNLLTRLAKSVSAQVGTYELVIHRIEDLITLSTEKFYAFPFKNVPACWRELFRVASLLKFSALAMKDTWSQQKVSVQDTPPFSDAIMDEMVRTIDMALIMSGPPPSPEARDIFNVVLQLLESCELEFRQSAERSPKRRKPNAASQQVATECPQLSTPAVTAPVPRTASPSFESFETHMQTPQNNDLGPEPVIITNSLDSWPARGERPWADPKYLLSKTIGGRRLVPIETGRSYVDEGWGQKIITFKEFLNEYVFLHSASATGYLAQHDLFAQISSLRCDIAVPDYCYTSPPPPHRSSPLAGKHSTVSQLEDPLLNAWFGPAGTISPLHTDPYHNILAQVVGRKYVRLYAPRDSERLYARGTEDGGVDMSNTSAIDVGLLAGWDGTERDQKDAHARFPLFKETTFVDCILEEGECLYIPVGWWHYVRSLSVSFSVSFWFN